MNKLSLLLGTLFLSLITFASGAVQAVSAEDELKRFFDGVQSLSAHFTQRQIDEKAQVLSTTSGRMWLARPGRFRWAYEQPYEQLIVCDGVKIWLYDKDLSQVTVRPAAQALGGTPAALLSQKSSLLQEFSLQDLGGKSGERVLKLIPKAKDTDFTAIELALRNGTPVRMKFFDQLGGTTDISFTQTQTNTKIDPALLAFTPPKGVEVISADPPK